MEWVPPWRVPPCWVQRIPCPPCVRGRTGSGTHGERKVPVREGSPPVRYGCPLGWASRRGTPDGKTLAVRLPVFPVVGTLFCVRRCRLVGLVCFWVGKTSPIPFPLPSVVSPSGSAAGRVGVGRSPLWVVVCPGVCLLGVGRVCAVGAMPPVGGTCLLWGGLLGGGCPQGCVGHWWGVCLGEVERSSLCSVGAGCRWGDATGVAVVWGWLCVCRTWVLCVG